MTWRFQKWHLHQLNLRKVQHKQTKLTWKRKNIPTAIHKLYTPIGTVFHLPWEWNLLLPCFGLLPSNSHIYTETVGPACRPICSIPQLWYWHGTVQGSVFSIWLKTSRLPAFSDLAVLFIYAYSVHNRLYCRIQICTTNRKVFFVKQ